MKEMIRKVLNVFDYCNEANQQVLVKFEKVYRRGQEKQNLPQRAGEAELTRRKLWLSCHLR